MKKVLIVLISATFIFSQGLGFGAKIGTNSAKSDISGAKSASGVLFGGIVKLDLLAITTDIEANYLSYGSGDDKFSYLQVPFSARIGLLPLPVVSIYARGGVQYEIPLSAKKDGLKENLNSGLSIVIGAGAELDLPVIPGAIIDFRYIIPMYTSLKDDVKGETKEVLDSKTSHFQMSLGIIF